jgi:Helix-turn-helix domain
VPKSTLSPRPEPKQKATRVTSFDPLVAGAFGLVARSMREERGIAQDAFALAAGVDRSYYGKLERGQWQPSLQHKRPRYAQRSRDPQEWSRLSSSAVVPGLSRFDPATLTNRRARRRIEKSGMTSTAYIPTPEDDARVDVHMGHELGELA